MAPESSVDVTDLLQEWRESILSGGSVSEREFPGAHVRHLAEAVVKGNPMAARGRLAMNVIGRFPEAYAFVADRTSDQELRHRGAPVELCPLEMPSEEEHRSPSSTPAPVDGLQSDDEPLLGPWVPFTGSPPQPRNNLAVEVSEGVAHLSWHPPAGAGAAGLYRVTYNDEFPPYSPEAGTHLATRATQCDIDMPSSHAIRCVQAWVHPGETSPEARASAPVPLADTVLVAQPSEISTREDQGQIYCRWLLPNSAGDYHPIVDVQVTRFLATGAGGRGSTSGESIGAELSGFHDSTAEPGRDYVYRMVVTAELADGRQVTSEPVETSVTVSAILEEVGDLTCARVVDERGRESFEAEWSAPFVGQVLLYRTPDEIPAGHAGREMATADLPGLIDEECELPNPVVPGVEPGRSRITGIRRPHGWPLMYLTPVTVLRDRCVIGSTATSETALAAPEGVRVVERVYEQQLRFGWPEGADEVRVYIGPRADRDSSQWSPSGEPAEKISYADYRRAGLVGLQLPPSGASVALRSSKNLSGRYVEGQAAVTDYPGLLRLKYTAQIKRSVLRRLTVEVSVWVDQAQQNLPTFRGRPHFVVVHHDERLPLHASDGNLLVMEPKEGGSRPAQRFQPSSVLNGPGLELWTGHLGAKTGFVRLFLSEGPDLLSRTALLDPPVKKLRVG